MKRIAICSDGTWQTPNQANTSHVIEMARAVLPTAPDGTVQVVFYDWGVGTESWANRLAGGVSGKGIERNIRDCYRFLIHNYEDGDGIYLFGFSRGAYTVRSLAGLIRNCGVLRKAEAGRLSEAYDMYRRKDTVPDSEEAKAFRSAYSREATIEFIGVWDTVGALGIPLRGLSKLTAYRHEFHDVELSGYVKHGCHALAIDECRRPFRPSLWQAQPKPGQIVEQVWFSGEHSDVGGSGNPVLGEPAFTWMKGRASHAGLVLDETPISSPNCPPALTGDRRPGWLSWIGAKVRGWMSEPRQIGGDETQWVHPSVRDRYARDPSGLLENLANYLGSPEARIYGEYSAVPSHVGRADDMPNAIFLGKIALSIPIIIAVIVGLLLFFRDGHPLGSLFTVGALVFAASAHQLRQGGFANPRNRNGFLWHVVEAIARWPFLLLVMEWLSIAIAGHFLLNEFDAPYQWFTEWLCCSSTCQQFTEWLSCSFACYKSAYITQS